VISVFAVGAASAQETDMAPPTDSSAESVEAVADDQASAQQTPVAHEIEAELGRLRQALEDVIELRRQLERASSDLAQTRDAAQERVAELAVAMRGLTAGSEQADRMYNVVVGELQNARQRLRSALETWQAPSDVPEYTPLFNVESVDVQRFRQQIETAQTLTSDLTDGVAAARREEREHRWRVVGLYGDLVRRLNELRIENLGLLSPANRARILGLSRDGVAQLLREIDHAALSADLYRQTRLKQVRDARALTRDLFVIGSLSYSVVRLALVIAAILAVRKRWRRWLDRLRRTLFRSARSVSWKRRTEGLLGLVETAAPWGLFLIAVAAIRWALRPAITAPESIVVYQVVLIYGFYRLAIDLTVGLFVRIGRHYRLQIADDREAKILTTVRWVMRIATPIAVLLLVASRVLGRGYLFHLVVGFSWLIALAALLGIVISWRHVAAEAFLAVQPTGRLAALVRSARGRWYGVLMTPGCFLWMTGRAILAVARDFALGFEQTRRALAFLFRRRIERQAEVRGYADVDPGHLPEAFLEAFTEDAVTHGPLVIDHFPGLGDLHGALVDWREQRGGGAFLLTGERGCGKTSWLRQVDGGDLIRTNITLQDRPASSDELASVLGRALAADTSSTSNLEGLRSTLTGGPRRIVIIDLAQHLFLAAVGGYTTFDAFTTLIEQTHHRVFWVCSMSAFAWQRLRAVRPTPIVFRHHQHLGGWSEDRIRELIRARTAVAGVRLNYGDLVVDRMEGVSAQARLIESEEGYTRLLWDYSDGNPRVALHFFLRSLVPEGADAARVRLFRAPAVEVLERLDEDALFTLASVVTHENVTLGEAVAVTRYPEELCRIHLDRLSELGVLRWDGRRYRIATFWHRAAVRLLFRMNLLAD
jgi:hypothetical protein